MLRDFVVSETFWCFPRRNVIEVEASSDSGMKKFTSNKNVSFRFQAKPRFILDVTTHGRNATQIFEFSRSRFFTRINLSLRSGVASQKFEGGQKFGGGQNF